MSPRLRAAIWAAVSSERQAEDDKISLSDQLTTGYEHAKRHNLDVVAELVVPGESRSIVLFEDACKRIEAYRQLRDLLDRRAIDVFIYYNRARLGRISALSMTVIELCHEARVSTYETTNPPARVGENSRADRMIGAINSVTAQDEIDELRERHRKGMIGRVKAGKLPSGVAPYGYRFRIEVVNDKDVIKHVEVDPSKADVVRRMIAMYLAGCGHHTIAVELNAEGITSSAGHRWNKQTVKQIVHNAWRYAGWSEINRKSTTRQFTRAKGAWPALIDEATAERVDAERLARQQNRTIADTPLRLTGVVWCVKCLKPMRQMTEGQNRDGSTRFGQFYCPARPERNHDKPNIIYKRVLAKLEEAIADLSSRDLNEMDIEEDDTLPALHAQIVLRTNNIAKLETSMQRADDAFVAGIMTKDRYEKQVRKLEQDIATEQRAIARLEVAAADEVARGTRRQRMQEMAARGIEALTWEDVTAANAWFRDRVRIWIEDNRVAYFEWL